MLAPYYNDISQPLIFTSSVFKIFIFQIEYSFPSSGLNLTWEEDLPIKLQALTNNTIKMKFDNSTKEMEENSFITKQTLSNVTFYQFTPLDISRTLLNETINNLIKLNQTQISIGSNKKSQVVDQNP